MNQIKRAIALVGGVAKLAVVLKVTPQAVVFWRDGKRRLPVEACPAIERATSGAVTRQALRPADWMDIWPELVALAGAGLVPQQQGDRPAAELLTADPALSVELARAEQAGLVKLPKQAPLWDGVERRVAPAPRRAADRKQDICQAGKGV